MVGIVSHGCYVPRYRLDRRLIFKAMSWMEASTASSARDEKAVAHFDEDSITFAVAASLPTVKEMDRSLIDGLYFSSTTMPYKERLNAAIAGALGMKDSVRTADITGGLKAGTTAMLAGLEAVSAGSLNQLVICASDCRLGKPASAEEMIFGNASAGFAIGSEKVIAGQHKALSCCQRPLTNQTQVTKSL